MSMAQYDGRVSHRPAGVVAVLAAADGAARLLQLHFDVDLAAEVAHHPAKRLARASQLLAFAKLGLDDDTSGCVCNHDMMLKLCQQYRLPSIETATRAAAERVATAKATGWSANARAEAEAAMKTAGAGASVASVAGWVAGLAGLAGSGASAALRGHAVDGAALLELTDSDLKEVGVPLLGHRKTLLRAIRALELQLTRTKF